MTLTEALQASRENGLYYSRPNQHMSLLIRWDENLAPYLLTALDILADDWEPAYQYTGTSASVIIIPNVRYYSTDRIVVLTPSTE